MNDESDEGSVTDGSAPDEDVECHRHPRVGHGFGLDVGTSAEGWIARHFWTKHNGSA